MLCKVLTGTQKVIDMEDFKQQIISDQINKQAKIFDDNIYKALEKHGYDVNRRNVHEFAKKHVLRNTVYENINTLWVDDTAICVWTNWEVEPFDFSKEFKINASFKFQIL